MRFLVLLAVCASACSEPGYVARCGMEVWNDTDHRLDGAQVESAIESMVEVYGSRDELEALFAVTVVELVPHEIDGWAGVYMGDLVYVHWSGQCLADTALIHELYHAVELWVDPCGCATGGHEIEEYWGVNGYVKQSERIAAAVCP